MKNNNSCLYKEEDKNQLKEYPEETVLLQKTMITGMTADQAKVNLFWSNLYLYGII